MAYLVDGYPVRYYANILARKTNTKSIIGTAGVRDILESLANGGFDTPTVCIGGVNGTNLKRVMFQSASLQKSLSGVAVVSAIMAAPDPAAEARKLAKAVKETLGNQPRAISKGEAKTAADILARVPDIITAVHKTTPLTHNMTNLVRQPRCQGQTLGPGVA